MKIEGAIFDLDGTLLDSMAIWDHLAEDYLLRRKINPKENLSKKFKEMSLYQAASYYQSHYGITDSIDEIIHDVTKMIEEFYLHQALPKAGIADFLAELQNRGVKMCVTTCNDRNLALTSLTHLGLLSFFKEILTCNDGEYSKDEPHIFYAAQTLLETPTKTTWVFEDAFHAVKTAKTAGFPVVAVYDKSESEQEKVRETADLVIHSFAEMRDYL